MWNKNVIKNSLLFFFLMDKITIMFHSEEEKKKIGFNAIR